jgi:hypothetical protein
MPGYMERTEFAAALMVQHGQAVCSLTNAQTDGRNGCCPRLSRHGDDQHISVIVDTRPKTNNRRLLIEKL